MQEVCQEFKPSLACLVNIKIIEVQRKILLQTQITKMKFNIKLHRQNKLIPGLFCA